MKKAGIHLRALAQRGELSLRFLHILLPAIALLLFLQLLFYIGAPPPQRVQLVPLLLLRVECLLHCLAASMGGAVLLECAARDCAKP